MRRGMAGAADENEKSSGAAARRSFLSGLRVALLRQQPDVRLVDRIGQCIWFATGSGDDVHVNRRIDIRGNPVHRAIDSPVDHQAAAVVAARPPRDRAGQPVQLWPVHRPVSGIGRNRSRADVQGSLTAGAAGVQ